MVKMKHILAAVTLLMAVAIGANAQNKQPIRYKLDANVGLGYLSPSNNNAYIDNSFKSHANYRFGASVDIPFTSNWFVNTGLTFASKNSNFEHELLNFGIKDGNITIRNHYVQIPINVGYRFNLGEKMGLSLMAGPYFAYAMRGKASFEDRLGANRSFNLYKEYGFKLPSAQELMQDPRVQQLLQDPRIQQLLQDPRVQQLLKDPRVQELLSGKEFKNEAIGKRFDIGIGGTIAFDVDRFYVQAGLEYGFMNTLNNDSWREVKSLLSKDGKDLKLNNFSGFVGLGVRF